MIKGEHDLNFRESRLRQSDKIEKDMEEGAVRASGHGGEGAIDINLLSKNSKRLQQKQLKTPKSAKKITELGIQSQEM